MVGLVNAAVAEDRICSDILPPNWEDCIMITPAITCTEYNYSIYNQTALVRTGNLTLLENNLYWFIFNETEGSYLVELCNHATREIIVEEGEMVEWFIILMAVAFVLTCLVLGFKYNTVFIYAGATCAAVFGVALLAGVLEDWIKYVLAMMLILISFAFVYYVRKEKAGKEEVKAGGDWI